VFCVKAHTEISCRTIISYSDVDLGNDIGTAPSGFCHSGTLPIHNSLYMQSLENLLKCEKKSWALYVGSMMMMLLALTGTKFESECQKSEWLTTPTK